MNRLCSANSIEAGNAGFVDTIFFAGEETSGGSQFALDVHAGEFYAAPALGVGAWESAAALSIPSINETHVAWAEQLPAPGAEPPLAGDAADSETGQ